MQKQKLKEILQTVSITFCFLHSRFEPSHLVHYEKIILDFLKKKKNQPRNDNAATLLLLPGGNCLIGISYCVKEK